MGEIKRLKSVNDFIIGLALLALGVYVLFTGDIVTGNVSTGDGGLLVRPDVYVRIIGGFLAFFSAVLVLKAVHWTKRGSAGNSGSKVEFALTREVLCTLGALAVYGLLLELTLLLKYRTGLRDGIGFFVATFLLIVFLTLVFRRKEKYSEGFRAVPRKTLAREGILIAVYAVILDIVVWAVFSQVLNVSLP
ncbi:MAG: tripartite tricarboxylate transporter TctB family protein [Spirochaetaceae bacterium]|jgi:hypothetical protein|nr:tripartite tricarboxylate transporter TctB family protein [Spirochaetaceae bacterium]